MPGPINVLVYEEAEVYRGPTPALIDSWLCQPLRLLPDLRVTSFPLTVSSASARFQ